MHRTAAGCNYRGDIAYFAVERREMLPYVPEGARRILEVGCGSGAFATLLRTVRGAYVVGIEPQPAAAAQAARRLDSVIEGDIDSSLGLLSCERFDCIVFNDVLEHLVDPWAALAAVRPLLSADGVVVASIPNMRYMLSALTEFDGPLVTDRDGRSVNNMRAARSANVMGPVSRSPAREAQNGRSSSKDERT